MHQADGYLQEAVQDAGDERGFAAIAAADEASARDQATEPGKENDVRQRGGRAGLWQRQRAGKVKGMHVFARAREVEDRNSVSLSRGGWQERTMHHAAILRMDV